MTNFAPRSAELHPGPGFRVRTAGSRPDPSLITKLAEFDIPEVSDALNRLYALDPGISSVNESPLPLAGPVTTVRVFPGDNLMVHKVLDIAVPGDVVVVSAHGDLTMNAILGDTICAKAQHRGIAGFVVDGVARDMPEVDELGVPVYARGTTAVGPLHRGPGEINYPVACGGVVVNPGDLLMADRAGIVIIPRDFAAQLLARLEAGRESAAIYAAQVRAGDFSMDWVDNLLNAAGCVIEPPPST